MTPPTSRSEPRPGAELLEREDELARLAKAVDDAKAGRGGVCMIEGPPGIGKSSLLAAAGELAVQRKLDYLHARANGIEQELPYGTLRQLLEGHLRRLDQRECQRLLSGAAEPAAAALGLSSDRVTGINAINGLFWLTAALAERQPLAWMLDDLQWIDPGSARFLAFAAPRLSELPVLLLLAARSGPDGICARLAQTASDPAAMPIAPRPLSLQASSALAERILPAALPSELATACHRVSGGNPFCLGALLEQLAGDGSDGKPAPDQATIVSLAPPAVARVLNSQIAALEPPAPAVARAVAILADDASSDLITRLTGAAPDPVADAIDRLTAAAIFTEDDRPTFLYPMLRNSVYGAIRRAERDRLHRLAAELLLADGAAPESVGRQLLATRPSGDDATVEMLLTLATAATGNGGQSAAIAYLRRAWAEPPSTRLRQTVRLELAEAELTTDGAAASERLQTALTDAEPGPERVRIVRSLAAAYLKVGKLGSLTELLRAEIPRAEGSGSEAAALEADLAMALLTGLDGTAMGEAHLRVEHLAPRLTGQTTPERTLLSCLAYSRLCRGLPVDEVTAPLRLRLANAPEEGPKALSDIDWLMCAGVLLRCGELELTEQLARQGLKAAQSAGSLFGHAGAQWVLGASLAAAGRLQEAVPALESALRDARDFGAEAGVHTALVSLVAVAIERGELAAAAAALAAEELDRGSVDAVVTPGELLEIRAGLRLALGDPAAALEDYGRVADYARTRGDLGPGMTLWRLGAARARLRLGQLDEARDLAGEELARARRFGAPAVLGRVLVVAAQTSGGRPNLELLEEAVEHLAGTPCRVEHARALIELGACLRREGRRAAARNPLREGMQIARDSGAIPLAERAFEELRATGARPRKVLRVGLDTLTASEHRVAGLAASGLKNREIAQELFVSPRTVEFHLRQVFAKLGASSRTELPALLAGDSGPPRE